MSYTKPLFAPVHSERESAGCCFYYNNAGQGFYYYSGGAQPTDLTVGPGAVKGLQLNGTLLYFGPNSAGVTPLCGTGLPATQPQTFGLPVGVTGVRAIVASDGRTAVDVDPSSAGVSVAGQNVNPSGVVIACTQAAPVLC